MIDVSEIGKANLKWDALGFSYTKTPFRFHATFKDGHWSTGELLEENSLSISEGSTALNYGQGAFEGLKAFATEDGRVALFRPDMNARRLAQSAERLIMPVVPEELFLRAAKEVVKANLAFVPPFGSGASLYLRPLLIGVGDNLGIQPANEYQFVVFCSPTGPYFNAKKTSVKLVIFDEYDRAATHGIGHIKASANYAATLQAKLKAKSLGYDEVLYLDSSEHRYIDETGASNFFVIRDDLLVTPKSSSILESITRLSLVDIAKHLGITVEHRALPLEEIKAFDEAGCCGTAAVIAPVSSIQHNQEKYEFKIGHDTTYYKLGQHLTAIQQNRKDQIKAFSDWQFFID